MTSVALSFPISQPLAWFRVLLLHPLLSDRIIPGASPLGLPIRHEFEAGAMVVVTRSVLVCAVCVFPAPLSQILVLFPRSTYHYSLYYTPVLPLVWMGGLGLDYSKVPLTCASKLDIFPFFYSLFVFALSLLSISFFSRFSSSYTSSHRPFLCLITRLCSPVYAWTMRIPIFLFTVESKSCM
jgi:hypothetical protein